MGRVGAARDNPAMESFFALLQNKVLVRRTWVSREQFRLAMMAQTQKECNSTGHKAALGRLTHIEIEGMVATPVTWAA